MRFCCRNDEILALNSTKKRLLVEFKVLKLGFWKKTSGNSYNFKWNINVWHWLISVKTTSHNLEWKLYWIFSNLMAILFENRFFNYVSSNSRIIYPTILIIINTFKYFVPSRKSKMYFGIKLQLCIIVNNIINILRASWKKFIMITINSESFGYLIIKIESQCFIADYILRC